MTRIHGIPWGSLCRVVHARLIPKILGNCMICWITIFPTSAIMMLKSPNFAKLTVRHFYIFHWIVIGGNLLKQTILTALMRV